ncbi:MAG: glycosyltransferase [Holophagales bacterium]|nr:glycosyltransferase [Holophagales bacterium]
MAARATVLVPTHDHGPTLEWSVSSALEQTIADLEVFIVGDGPSEAGIEAARALECRDERVRFFCYDKGRRHGEAHRHRALQQATGGIFCYLSDDDLWLPDHVERLLELLEEADFAHTLPLAIGPRGRVSTWQVDLEQVFYRSLILNQENRIPLSCAAHTASFYRGLEVGWSPAPPDIPTDLHMWRHLLGQVGAEAKSGATPTVLHFPSHERTAWSLDQRLAELQEWAERCRRAGWRERLLAWVVEAQVRERAELETEMARHVQRADAAEREFERLERVQKASHRELEQASDHGAFLERELGRHRLRIEETGRALGRQLELGDEARAHVHHLEGELELSLRELDRCRALVEEVRGYAAHLEDELERARDCLAEASRYARHLEHELGLVDG